MSQTLLYHNQSLTSYSTSCHPTPPLLHHLLFISITIVCLCQRYSWRYSHYPWKSYGINWHCCLLFIILSTSKLGCSFILPYIPILLFCHPFLLYASLCF